MSDLDFSRFDPILLTEKKSHTPRWALISLFIIALTVVVLDGVFVAMLYNEKPPSNLDGPSSEERYMQLWGARTKALPPHFTVQASVDDMRNYAIYFLYDSYPKLSEVPEATNLALQWPPRRGSRYRIAAYPFVQTSQDPLPIAILKGIFKMTNKYADQATPPAWYVSVYDETDWTKDNIFMPPGVAPGSKDSATTHLCCRSSKIFGPFQWVEVTRTCYPVSKDSYPLCDDGGQWYYHAPGSGVWYNLGNCVVRYNKIDAAIYCMALLGVQSEIKNSGITLESVFKGPLSDGPSVLLLLDDNAAQIYEGTLDTPGCTLDAYSGKTTWSDFWSTAKAQFAARLKQHLGDKSFVRSMSKLIKDARAKDADSLQLAGFLPFQAFHVKKNGPLAGYVAFLSAIAGVLGAAVALLITLPASLFGQCNVLLPLLLLAAGGAGGWFIWQYGLDAFVSSQGVNMIARGLELYSVSPEDVVDFCVEPTVGAADTEKQQFFSGLPSSWIADMSIELFSSMLGFDVVVMHTQPNKSGTYLVEMCDVTKIKTSFGPTPGQPAWWKGGTCGGEDITGFACSSCPSENARSSLLGSRGGLCFNQLIPNFNSNYMTMNWRQEPNGPTAAGKPPLRRFPIKGNFSSSDRNDMTSWLHSFNASSCVCRESKDALCIGCEGTVSDLLCNWAQRGNLAPTSA
jgi:hypothetical protein